MTASGHGAPVYLLDTVLLAAGESVTAVAERLGHENARPWCSRPTATCCRTLKIGPGERLTRRGPQG
jgi:hypothetical protein